MKDLFSWKFGLKTWVRIIYENTLYTAKKKVIGQELLQPNNPGLKAIHLKGSISSPLESGPVTCHGQWNMAEMMVGTSALSLSLSTLGYCSVNKPTLACWKSRETWRDEPSQRRPFWMIQTQICLAVEQRHIGESNGDQQDFSHEASPNGQPTKLWAK